MFCTFVERYWRNEEVVLAGVPVRVRPCVWAWRIAWSNCGLWPFQSTLHHWQNIRNRNHQNPLSPAGYSESEATESKYAFICFFYLYLCRWKSSGDQVTPHGWGFVWVWACKNGQKVTIQADQWPSPSPNLKLFIVFGVWRVQKRHHSHAPIFIPKYKCFVLLAFWIMINVLSKSLGIQIKMILLILLGPGRFKLTNEQGGRKNHILIE